MAKTGELPMVDVAQLLHAALLLEGVSPGAKIPRESWDDLVIVTTGAGHPSTIRNYTRVGKAKRLWSVTEAHGRGGRGFVTILPGPEAVADQAVAPVAVPA